MRVPPFRRLVTALLPFGVAITTVLASPAGAQTPAPIDVIEVSGLIDPVIVDFIEHAIRDAARQHHQALIIQLSSGGTVVSQRRLDQLAQRIARSPVPVGVWLGQSGAHVRGGAARLAVAAAFRSRAPTLGDFIVGLDGRELGGHTLHTARVVQRGAQPRREPIAQVTFAKPALVARLLHTVASPAVAYLLLLTGLALIAFEFYSVGVGLAGATGAGCLVLSAYGLAALPVRWWALGLLALAVFGFCVDVQAGAPRTWTGIAAVSLLVGSLWLYHGQGVSLRWPALLLGLLGMALFMLAGMPAMLRARFGTPTIGRESMIGEAGQATAGLDPEGMVRVRGALWRARTNRATPIAVGEPVRVVAIDGVVLEVEPVGRGSRLGG